MIKVLVVFLSVIHFVLADNEIWIDQSQRDLSPVRPITTNYGPMSSVL